MWRQGGKGLWGDAFESQQLQMALAEGVVLENGALKNNSSVACPAARA